MARIFVGNLPAGFRERDIDDVFYKYGKIRSIELKSPLRPPAFAFVAYDDIRDAEDAVRGRDGYEVDGCRLRVEMAHGSRDDKYDDYGGYRGRAPYGVRGGYRGFGGNGRMNRGGGKQTEHRVIVTGLPATASWQDLKDHMRKAGNVVYTDVDHRGGGIVHFASRSDKEYALRKLDDSEFRNPFDRSIIRVLPHRSSSRSISRSPPKRRRRGYSSSRSFSKSRSRDRSFSHSRSRSRSVGVVRSKSRSKSPVNRIKSESVSPRKEFSPNSNEKLSADL